MDRISCVVDIDQPPAVVYDFLTDDENKPLWLQNFVRFERIKGREGQVGAVSRQIFQKRNGKKIALLEEITAAEAGHALQTSLRDDEMAMKMRAELQPIGEDSTRLALTREFAPTSFWGRVLFFFNKKARRKQHELEIQNLKKAVETLGEAA